MIQIFKRNKKITKLFLLLFFLCCTAFLLIFYIESDKPITKKKQTAAKTTADKPTSISYCVTSLSDEEESTLVYHPTERVLSQFIRKKNQYIRNIWDEKSGWTTNVESWKIKKSETLEHFSYNTNGALYACKKKWSKGKLAKQSIVCLRNNGNIKNINLIHLNNKQNTDEIKDIRCNGTSIAITYQYGNVTIYNLLERLAFGGSSISGMFPEFFPLIFIRLFSSSAATGLVLDIFKTYGTDSLAGRITSILMSCTETCFYTMSVYFMTARVSKSRYTLAGALFSTAVGVVMSVLLAYLM